MKGGLFAFACWFYLWLELLICSATKRCPPITASLTFALLVEGGVTAADAAIVVVASLVNAAFWKTEAVKRSLQIKAFKHSLSQNFKYPACIIPENIIVACFFFLFCHHVKSRLHCQCHQDLFFYSRQLDSQLHFCHLVNLYCFASSTRRHFPIVMFKRKRKRNKQK